MNAHTVSLVTPGGQLLATGNPSCNEMLAPATPGSSTTLRTISLGYQYCLSGWPNRSEEHTSELQSHHDLVCRLLLEKKKKKINKKTPKKYLNKTSINN